MSKRKKKLEQNNSMQIDRWWKCNLTKIMYISQSHELEPMPFYAITGQITGSIYTNPVMIFCTKFCKGYIWIFFFNFFFTHLKYFESEMTASYASIPKLHYKQILLRDDWNWAVDCNLILELWNIQGKIYCICNWLSCRFSGQI